MLAVGVISVTDGKPSHTREAAPRSSGRRATDNLEQPRCSHGSPVNKDSTKHQHKPRGRALLPPLQLRYGALRSPLIAIEYGGTGGDEQRRSTGVEMTIAV